MQRSYHFQAFVLSVAVFAAPAWSASIVADISFHSPDAAGLQETVDEFREALGPNNGNNPVNADPNGRRQINWDAAPDAISDPNAFPGDFFNFNANPRARGNRISGNGRDGGLLLSSTEASGQPVGFGFEEDFQPFSPNGSFRPWAATRLTCCSLIRRLRQILPCRVASELSFRTWRSRT